MAIKGQAVAEFLAEFTYPEQAVEEATQPAQPPQVHSSTATWTLFVDGSSNKNGCGAGIILTTPDGFQLEYALRFGFTASNNEAEYEALLAGLQLAVSMGAEQIHAYSDSQLVVNQVLQEYEAREDRMAAYLALVRGIVSGLTGFSIEQIPRANNVRADRLAQLASSPEPTLAGINVEHLPDPSINRSEGMEVDPVDPGPSWMDPIIEFHLTGTLPADKTEARRLRLRAVRYHLSDGILFKKGFTLPYLRCVHPIQAQGILREIHEGICGSHIGGRALSRRALIQGYYWPTMAQDSKEYVKRCDKCQRYAPRNHIPGELQTPIQSPWPFAQWGIDLVGPLPIGRGQVKFAVIAVDYFTKWAEGEPLAQITERKMEGFLEKNIITRFGIPRVLVSDNGRQFDTPVFRQFCSQLGISNHYSSPEHPQANGQAEVTNRTILRSIKTRLEQAKGLWADEMPSLLWAYRTTPRASTGETPFSLTFGYEAMVPTELAWPTHRVTQYNSRENEEAQRAELDMVEEKRDQAYVRTAAYKQRVARYYNQRVQHRSFQVGSLVLKAVNQSTREPTHGKFGPTWEGPYRVSRVSRPGTYWLQTLDGRELTHPWNIAHLRQYYQ